MQINPGGRLNIEDVIGRDDEIDRYWRVLERQGLVLSAERRIGKTHILLKMCGECRPGYLPFYQDLESVHSVADLIRSIYNAMDHSLRTVPGLKAHIAKWSGLLPKRIAGVDLPSAEATWPVLLADAFDDLIRIADGARVLMLWDEFPLMLYNLQRAGDHDIAIRLLDHLRALRLAHADRIQFLFTGSIGLHLVLRSLREAGNANDPVNDMLSLTVPPMAEMHTTQLAAALLAETRAVSPDIPGLAARIVEEVGGFPYYVHHVVDQLDQLRRAPSLDDISATVDSLVNDPHDPANLRYYVNRLSRYYTDRQRSLALLALDMIALQPAPVSVRALLNLCRHHEPSLDDELFRDVLALLAEDHYIEPAGVSGAAGYDFRWQLVKRWWERTRT